MRARSSGPADQPTLNQIVQHMTKSADVRSGSEGSLGEGVELKGLQSGWLCLCDPTSRRQRDGAGTQGVYDHSLPLAMALSSDGIWLGLLAIGRQSACAAPSIKPTTTSTAFDSDRSQAKRRD
jgi:hypothetical protein